jgi:CTP synthase
MSSTKYIFVTGGVVSGLGKGITAASIGLLLKNNGISVTALKLDPYLNVDPGTMSPFEHGEVFVLSDGSECDLDLGHYERFLETTLDTNSSITSGKIYSAILEKERMGEFLGKNVQLIPNVTNYIKDCFEINSDKFDVKIIEIGGSAGDMEGEIFLESLRQFKQKNKKNVIHLHLGYVPFLGCSGEYKTKPFQASLKELLRDGIQPDILVARYEPNSHNELTKDQLDKLALFGNVENEYVIPVPDLHSIYAVPNHLNKSSIKNILSEFVQKPLDKALPDFFLSEGKVQNPTKTVKVGVVGKYGSKLGDADYSVMQSINIAGFHAGVEVQIIIISAEELEQGNLEAKNKLKESDCIMVLGGFGIRGMEGKIEAIKYARENQKPFLGICLGLQMAVVEFARNVCGIDAYSAEMFENGTSKGELVIDFMQGQQNIQKKGGTMRLGDYKCDIIDGTLAKTLFGTSSTIERHRHRLEVQSKYLDLMESKGLKVSGKFNYTTSEGNQEFLPEIMELDNSIHPYFIGIQSHPEMLSRPTKPHPLFLGLIKACL